MLQLPALRAKGEWLRRVSDQIAEFRLGLEARAQQTAHASGRIREIHTAHGRVCEVLGKVDQLVALDKCGHAVELALKSGRVMRTGV